MSTKYETSKYASDSDDSDSENVAVDVEKLPPLEIGPGEHKLQYSYCLWYHRGSTTKFKSPTEYSKSLHFVGRCASVEQFWSMYCHLVRPSAMAPYRELHLFKNGIKPMWEDPTNAAGGKWVIRLRKNKIDRAWENVCMAMLGEQFLVGPEICGIVLSTRYPEDLLSVWNRTASDTASTNRIRDTLRRILNLPPNTLLEYKNHNECLKYLKAPVAGGAQHQQSSAAAAAASSASAPGSAAAAAAAAATSAISSININTVNNSSISSNNTTGSPSGGSGAGGGASTALSSSGGGGGGGGGVGSSQSGTASAAATS